MRIFAFVLALVASAAFAADLSKEQRAEIEARIQSYSHVCVAGDENCAGAGAAAVACMELLIKCGALREHIYMLDRKGVIHTRRDDLNEYKKLFANK